VPYNSLFIANDQSKGVKQHQHGLLLTEGVFRCMKRLERYLQTAVHVSGCAKLMFLQETL